MASQPSRRWVRPLIGLLLTLAWVALAGLGGPYFGRIDEVATNDQSSYLPSSAESTQVQKRFTDFYGDDTIPAVVVAERAGGLTAEDKAWLAAQSTQLPEKVDAIPGAVSPAIPSQDGMAAQMFVPLSTDADVTSRRRRTARGPRGGPRGPRGVRHRRRGAERRPGQWVRRRGRPAAGGGGAQRADHPGHRLPISAAADHGAARLDERTMRRRHGELLSGQGGSLQDQRPGTRDPLDPGHRGDDGLLAAVRLALPGGATRQRVGLECDQGRLEGIGRRRSLPPAARSSPGCCACSSPIWPRTRRWAPSPRSASSSRSWPPLRSCRRCSCWPDGPRFGRGTWTTAARTPSRTRRASGRG